MDQFPARLSQQAEEALENGHIRGARELFLLASAFDAASYHPLYSNPVDSRLLNAFRGQTNALNRAFSLFDPEIVPVVRIPFEQTSMPAYLVPAEGMRARYGR